MTLQHGETLSGGLFAYDGGITDIVTAEIGGKTLAYTINGTGGGITVFEIAANGDLTQVDSFAFSHPFSVGVTPKLSIAAQGSDQVLVVAGQDLANAGALTLNSDGTIDASAGWTGFTDTITSPTIIDHAGTELLYVSSPEGGISAISVAPNGTTSELSNIQSDVIDIDEVSDLTSVTSGGSTFLVASSIS